MGGNLSFFDLAQEGSYSEVFLLMVPICSVVAFSGKFKEELINRVLPYSLVRSGKTRYSTSKIVMTMIGGGTMAAIAILFIYLLLFFIVAPDAGQLERLFLYKNLYLKHFIQNLVLGFLNGSLWSLFGGISSLIFQEQYVGYAIPFICYYIFSEFQQRYYSELYFLNPRNLASPIITGFLVAICGLLILNLICIAGYRQLILHKLKHS